MIIFPPLPPPPPPAPPLPFPPWLSRGAGDETEGSVNSSPEAPARMAGATSERDADTASLYLRQKTENWRTAPRSTMIASDNLKNSYRKEAGALCAYGSRFFSIRMDYRRLSPLRQPGIKKGASLMNPLLPCPHIFAVQLYTEKI